MNVGADLRGGRSIRDVEKVACLVNYTFEKRVKVFAVDTPWLPVQSDPGELEKPEALRRGSTCGQGREPKNPGSRSILTACPRIM